MYFFTHPACLHPCFRVSQWFIFHGFHRRTAVFVLAIYNSGDIYSVRAEKVEDSSTEQQRIEMDVVQFKGQESIM
jgi:hypothetical protein